VSTLDGRISKLEGRIKPATSHTTWSPEREALIAELKHLEERGGPLWEKARREADEGDARRLHALEELEEVVRQRREQ
jgi:hypothetical protein